jgi:hypothetical protein
VYDRIHASVQIQRSSKEVQNGIVSGHVEFHKGHLVCHLPVNLVELGCEAEPLNVVEVSKAYQSADRVSLSDGGRADTLRAACLISLSVHKEGSGRWSTCNDDDLSF